MYIERHRDGTYDYFVYSPITDGGGPNAPFKDAPKRMCTVYYFWWSFLRLNEDYLKCCASRGGGRLAKIYEDFGDVRNNDFLWWWRQRRTQCFAEPKPEQVKDFSSSKRIEEGKILVSIPRIANPDTTVEEIRQLLASVQPERKGRVPMSGAKYPVATNPNLPSLYYSLKVKQAEMRLAKMNLPKKATGIQIEVAARLFMEDDKAQTERFPSDEDFAAMVERRAKAITDSVERREISTKVTKALTRANNLIKNVVLGQFPVTEAPKVRRRR